MLSVREIMHDGVVGIRPDASVHELFQLLAQEQISGVPVLGAGSELIGVVSATDLVVCAAIHGQPDNRMPWEQFQVQDIMTPAACTASPDTTVAELARFMVAAHIHRALVTDNGKLLGIVTAFDIMRAAASTLKSAVGHQTQKQKPEERPWNPEMESVFW